MSTTFLKRRATRRHLRNHFNVRSAARRGFTLVELLIAIALVVLMMSLFAQVFSLAANIMTRQRGLSTNDQSERALNTVMRDDFAHRTFRDVTPFATATAPVADDPKRQGYFYISEGNIFDDTDDVLQFSVNRKTSKSGKINIDAEPFYGHSVELPGFPIATNPNQPEFDDEFNAVNNTGSSHYAQVSYFLRYNVLYRRVTLIRDPKVGTSDNPQAGATGTGAAMLTAPYTSGEFLRDFDYSAYFDTSATAPVFLGVGALPNNLTTLGTRPVSFGVPSYRFGHDFTSGQPRETVTDSSSVTHFIGRFRHKETSDDDFDYPGQNPASNPLAPGTQLAFDTNQGLVTLYSSGIRTTEDVLLTNVHAFNIMVWDPAYAEGLDGKPGIAGADDDSNGTVDDISELGWSGSDDYFGTDGKPGVAGVDDDVANGVDDIGELGWPGSDDGDWKNLGHPSLTGFYRVAARANAAYGEKTASANDGNCYDTWHPSDTGMPGSGPTPYLAPYRPVLGGNGQPLKLIQIRVRYVEPKSDQMRDVSLILSLTDS